MDQFWYNIIILVLQGITIFVTVITLIANLISTKKENAKARMVEITIKHRLEEMKELKTFSAQYLTYLNPIIISTISEKEYSLKLLTLHNQIKNLLKIKYEQDKVLLQEMEIAKQIALQYNKTKNNQIKVSLNNCIKNLYSLFSLYTYANWVCIKEQSYGKELKSIDYRKVYEENYSSFIQE